MLNNEALLDRLPPLPNVSTCSKVCAVFQGHPALWFHLSRFSFFIPRPPVLSMPGGAGPSVLPWSNHPQESTGPSAPPPLPVGFRPAQRGQTQHTHFISHTLSLGLLNLISRETCKLMQMIPDLCKIACKCMSLDLPKKKARSPNLAEITGG